MRRRPRPQPALIWIKCGTAKSADIFHNEIQSAAPVRLSMQRPRPPIRHCPICGVAMQADRSRADLADFDMFRCLNCETIISESKPVPPPDGAGG